MSILHLENFAKSKNFKDKILFNLLTENNNIVTNKGCTNNG